MLTSLGGTRFTKKPDETWARVVGCHRNSHTQTLTKYEYNLHIPVAILFAVRSDKESLVEKLFVKNLTESWIFFQMFFSQQRHAREDGNMR